MRNLLDNLEEAEMNFNQVVATNVYLDDVSDLPVFDQVYGQYFGPALPARTTVQQIAPRSAGRIRTITSRDWSRSRSLRSGIDLTVEGVPLMAATRSFPGAKSESL